MTTAVLTSTLDEELLALLRGDRAECLVCGEPVEAEDEHVDCPACGSRLESRRRSDPGQLALL